MITRETYHTTKPIIIDGIEVDEKPYELVTFREYVGSVAFKADISDGPGQEYFVIANEVNDRVSVVIGDMVDDEKQLLDPEDIKASVHIRTLNRGESWMYLAYNWVSNKNEIYQVTHVDPGKRGKCADRAEIFGARRRSRYPSGMLSLHPIVELADETGNRGSRPRRGH